MQKKYIYTKEEHLNRLNEKINQINEELVVAKALKPKVKEPYLWSLLKSRITELEDTKIGVMGQIDSWR